VKPHPQDSGNFPLETDVQNQNRKQAILCEKCLKCRTERKESVLEFVNTETSYGEDLRIIKEEFYLPMQAAGLLTQEQLLVVFSNIQELIDLNENFLEYLQEEIEQAIENENHMQVVLNLQPFCLVTNYQH
uniref:DH domain-containing protein n=1 Tax=Laticauda laticaudata TaxID=8630 RepID=A0A8C5S4S7_LATLA